MKNYVISVKVETVIQVAASGNTVEEAKQYAINKVRLDYPRADIRVKSIDAGGQDV